MFLIIYLIISELISFHEFAGMDNFFSVIDFLSISFGGNSFILHQTNCIKLKQNIP